MPVLSVWSPEGGVLGVVAPLALAASAGTALVIDLDPHGPGYPGTGSLVRLAAEGPRRSDLSPERSGVAVLKNGGIEAAACRDIIAALCRGWPAVVLRLRSSAKRPKNHGVVPVRPLLPGDLFAFDPEPAVYQRCGWRIRPGGPGPVLPRPRSSTVQALLEGRTPSADRWVRSWRQVWEASWM
jgi:hypothetical protein